MTNLQRIKKEAKECGLTFTLTKYTFNGAKLYNFVDDFGRITSPNWTISSAINELKFGYLKGKIQ